MEVCESRHQKKLIRLPEKERRDWYVCGLKGICVFLPSWHGMKNTVWKADNQRLWTSRSQTEGKVGSGETIHMPAAYPFFGSFSALSVVHSRQTCYYKTCSQRTTKTNETALPSSTPHVLSSDSAKASNDRVEHSSQNSTLSSYFRAQRPL